MQKSHVDKIVSKYFGVKVEVFILKWRPNNIKKKALSKTNPRRCGRGFGPNEAERPERCFFGNAEHKQLLATTKRHTTAFHFWPFARITRAISVNSPQLTSPAAAAAASSHFRQCGRLKLKPIMFVFFGGFFSREIGHGEGK